MYNAPDCFENTFMGVQLILLPKQEPHEEMFSNLIEKKIYRNVWEIINIICYMSFFELQNDPKR